MRRRNGSLQFVQDNSLLALGYQTDMPGNNHHAIAQVRGIVSFYPNTLVHLLQRPKWKAIHGHIGDDLMIHLLSTFYICQRITSTGDAWVQVHKFFD